MDEEVFKNEVKGFVASLQRFLPKKDDLLVFERRKEKILRLSDIHVEAKSVFPTCFVGAKLVVLQEIMDRVKLVQHYNFNKTKDNYKCYSKMIYKELETNGSHDGLLVDTTGSATATYSEMLEGNYEMRLTSKIKDMISSETELVLEKESERSLGSFICSMRDVDPNTLHFTTQWTYSVMPEFCFGTEIGFKPLSCPFEPSFSFTARYDKPSFILSSTVSKTGFQVCFHKRLGPNLEIASIVGNGSRGEPAVFSLALQKSFESGSELKLFVDTQRCGGFTYQREVLFQETMNDTRVLRLVGSSLIDRQRRVRFGFGFHLDF